ncbi:MAG TPA: hypothetical protein DEF00_02685 [Candidatus Taylorbacteria bacterium]|nr:MAG: hypothetical protein UY03_C0023G0010 [Parcubacteria group bacterium GW2011_GWA2_47_64]KKU96600.1 MAG: hypothetical protein UY29_C0009G0014 [Parcubacteria group bacterium GW2011_GWC2_48_17]HBV01277.1 hypothetical protein [Candidatus Taylorbacteria bacterium]
MGVTQKVGSLGEELVVRFLVRKGYKILDRNFRRPWGELDIVATRKERIHFVEVKSVSDMKGDVSDETISRETSPREKALSYIRRKRPKDRYRPENNVHANKIKRLSRIIQTYLSGKHVSDETTWQFDVATVYVNEGQKKAKINLMEEIIL